MKKYLSLVVMLVGGCLFVMAQSGQNIVKYISENKLYRNGNDVTVTKINMEWPLAFDGDGMGELQKELCRTALGVDTESLQDGWTRLHDNLGSELEHMPDNVTRHYIDIDVEEIWRADGQYVSLYVTRQQREQDGSVSGGVKKFMTYDLVNGQMLEKNDVFANNTDIDSRTIFEAFIEQNAVCYEADMAGIDLTLLPEDFAVMGGSIAFGLGGPVGHNNFSIVSSNNLYQLGMLKRKFVRWIEGKAKKSKGESTVTIVPRDFDTSLSRDSIVTKVNALPSFPGGNDSLVSFISKNVRYPDADMRSHNQGRVVVSFIVETDGSLSDITVINPISPGLDREAVRVLKLMPRWIPANNNSRNVRTRMSLPFTFRLNR